MDTLWDVNILRNTPQKVPAAVQVQGILQNAGRPLFQMSDDVTLHPWASGWRDSAGLAVLPRNDDGRGHATGANDRE